MKRIGEILFFLLMNLVVSCFFGLVVGAMAWFLGIVLGVLMFVIGFILAAVLVLVMMPWGEPGLDHLLQTAPWIDRGMNFLFSWGLQNLVQGNGPMPPTLKVFVSAAAVLGALFLFSYFWISAYQAHRLWAVEAA